MKKFLFLIFIILSVAVGYSFAKNQQTSEFKEISDRLPAEKRAVLRFAVVSDSHGDNELLTKALKQAGGKGINFVVGLGDWSTTGTVDELSFAKMVFDDSKLTYYVTAGDHDLWDSRNRGLGPKANFNQVFGQSSHQFESAEVQIVILDNSDIYKGIDAGSWFLVTGSLAKPAKLRFVMAHKTPFHPESKHIMGEDSKEVSQQANRLIKLIESSSVDGFFSGDIHFFAQFKSPQNTVKITTVGAVARERNFQGPRFAVVTVYDDYSWQVEDVEIR